MTVNQVNVHIHGKYCLVLVWIVASIMFAANYAAAATSCPPTISSCGCVMDQASIYTVANALSAGQTSEPNCIEISASQAILNLKGNSVTGNGSGIGILIRRGAKHVLVEGSDEASSGNDNGGATVTSWNVGIEDDGDAAVIELFGDIGDSSGPGNITAGIVFNDVNGSVAGDLLADNNGQDGIILRHSSGVRLSNFNATGSSQAGVFLDSAADNTITTGTISMNPNVGLWLRNSSRNQIINCNGTTGNGTGILLGCGPAGCSGTIHSDDNRITNSGAPGNNVAGIVIEKKNERNIVTVTHNAGNHANNDMVDENPHCDSNIWYNNEGQGNQTCIQ